MDKYSSRTYGLRDEHYTVFKEEKRGRKEEVEQTELKPAEGVPNSVHEHTTVQGSTYDLYESWPNDENVLQYHTLLGSRSTYVEKTVTLSRFKAHRYITYATCTWTMIHAVRRTIHAT